MAETHADLQLLLADVRSWVPVVVDVNGTECQLTGIKIVHEHDENAEATEGTKAAIQGVGAQVKAVLTISSTEE